MRAPLPVLLLTLLLLAGCPADDPEPHERDILPEDTVPPEPEPVVAERIYTDEELLVMIEQLPPGSTHEEVAEHFPSLSAPQPPREGALPESMTDVRAFGRAAGAVFNYDQAGMLRSAVFTIERIECPQAAELYDQIKSFYDERYGAGDQEDDPAAPFAARSTTWDAPDGAVSLFGGRHGQACRVGWGYGDVPDNG